MFYEEAIGVFYDRELNVFVDEDGDVIWDIYSLLTPDDIYVFKMSKKDMIFSCVGQRDVVVEVYWPDTGTE